MVGKPESGSKRQSGGKGYELIISLRIYSRGQLQRVTGSRYGGGE
jgi:hypothetical protein